VDGQLKLGVKVWGTVFKFWSEIVRMTGSVLACFLLSVLLCSTVVIVWFA